VVLLFEDAAGGFRHAVAAAMVATTSNEESNLVKNIILEQYGRVGDKRVGSLNCKPVRRRGYGVREVTEITEVTTKERR
jgi:hypothetical protein